MPCTTGVVDGSMRTLPFAVIDVPEWVAGGPNVAAACCLQLLVTRRRAMRGALRAQEWNQSATRHTVISFGNKVGEGLCGPSSHVHGCVVCV